MHQKGPKAMSSLQHLLTCFDSPFPLTKSPIPHSGQAWPKGSAHKFEVQQIRILPEWKTEVKSKSIQKLKSKVFFKNIACRSGTLRAPLTLAIWLVTVLSLKSSPPMNSLKAQLRLVLMCRVCAAWRHRLEQNETKRKVLLQSLVTTCDNACQGNFTTSTGKA